MDRALTPKYCLGQMAGALSKMQDAQTRFAALQADIAAGVMDQDTMPDLQLAQGDTGYYAAQAQTWALAASALLAGLERYSPRECSAESDDDLRDCKPVVGTAVAAGFAINRQDRRRWPDA